MMGSRPLIISVDALPKIGGISTMAHHATNEIAKLCDKTVFVGPSDTHLPDGFTANYEIISDQRSKVRHKCGKEFKRERSRIISFLREIIAHHKLNRILLFHSFYYGPPALDTAHQLGIECEFIIHGTELTSQFPELINDCYDILKIQTDSLPFYLYYCLNNANHIYANSRFTRSIASKVAPHAAVSICGCGIPADLYKQLTQKALTPIQKREGRRHQNRGLQLCYIGRLVKHKHVESVFPLLENLDAQFVIIGDGPEEDTLRQTVLQMKLTNRVTFAGRTNEDEKFDILSHSDFLMLPSRFHPETGGYEGFGIVLLEAIAAGTLPVGTASEGTTDPIQHYGIGIEGLSDNVDLNATAELMLQYYKNPNLYQTKLNSDLETIRIKLLWTNVAQHITQRWASHANSV